MRWSWKIGEFAGIGVYLHATFLLLIGWVALSGWLQGRTAAAALEAVAFILALFFLVVLHEYGHALAARRYGIPTRDITLCSRSYLRGCRRAAATRCRSCAKASSWGW